MAVDMIVDDRVLKARFAKAPVKTLKAVKLGINAASIVVSRGMQKEAPQHDGALSRSITTTTTTYTAKVYPKAKYAIFVEKGTRPHFPPINAIEKWANDHGINPYVLAKSISKKGTKANPFVKNTSDKYSKQAGKVGSRVMARELEKI